MKGRVLVVDDDAALAEMLGIVLRGEGFEPIFVSDGDKAVEVFRESRPDLVLLDLMLPGSDGIDVCRQIRTESGVPIVMLTAKTDTVDVVLGLESGADDYISRSSSTCWSRWPASRGRSSPGRSCSSRSGVTDTPRTPGWSTCTCSGYARRSRRTPSIPRSS
jgi:CheY-like chemotaxis protein